MKMNISGVRWTDYLKEQLPDENVKPKVLGKGFDAILKREIQAMKKSKEDIKPMKYTLLSKAEVEDMLTDPECYKHIYLLDRNNEGSLVTYPIADMSIETLHRVTTVDSVFLYDKPFRKEKAQIMIQYENEPEKVYGTYDYETNNEKTMVFELSMSLRKKEGVVTTYINRV